MIYTYMTDPVASSCVVNEMYERVVERDCVVFPMRTSILTNQSAEMRMNLSYSVKRLAVFM